MALWYIFIAQPVCWTLLLLWIVNIFTKWMEAKVIHLFRNILIVVTYPLRFAIYCGMSQQFRNVVHQMVAERTIFFKMPPKGHNGFISVGEKLIPQMSDRRSKFLQKFITCCWPWSKKRQQSKGNGQKVIQPMPQMMNATMAHQVTRLASSQISVSILANGLFQTQKPMLKSTSI